MEYANIVKAVYYFRNLRGVRPAANGKLGTERILKHFWEEKKKKLPCLSFLLLFVLLEQKDNSGEDGMKLSIGCKLMMLTGC